MQGNRDAFERRGAERSSMQCASRCRYVIQCELGFLGDGNLGEVFRSLISKYNIDIISQCYFYALAIAFATYVLVYI